MDSVVVAGSGAQAEPFGEQLGPLMDLAGLAGRERARTFRKWRRWLRNGKVTRLIETERERGVFLTVLGAVLHMLLGLLEREA